MECGCSVKDLPKGLEVGRLLSSAPGIRVGLLAWVRGRCENLGIQNTGVTKLKKIPKGVFGLVGVGVHATTRGRDGTGYKLFSQIFTEVAAPRGDGVSIFFHLPWWYLFILAHRLQSGTSARLPR